MTVRVRDRHTHKLTVFKCATDLLKLCIDLSRNEEYFPKNSYYQRALPFFNYAREIKNNLFLSYKYYLQKDREKFNKYVELADDYITLLDSEVDLEVLDYDVLLDKSEELTLSIDRVRTSLEYYIKSYKG